MHFVQHIQRHHVPSKWGGTCTLRFLSQVDFKCSFQKTKNSSIIFYIFDTITPAWLNHSVRHIISCKIQIWVRWDRHVFTEMRIITNHTRFCWAYECNGQSEVFRWVIAEMLLLSSLSRWPNTSFWRILSLETIKCRCVYESEEGTNVA